MDSDTTIRLTITATKTMSYLTDYPGYSNFQPLYAGPATQLRTSTTSETKSTATPKSTRPRTSETPTASDSSSDSSQASNSASSSVSSSSSSKAFSSLEPTPTQVDSSDSQILNTVGHYKSDDSAKLGMAIGIPVGVVVLLLISLGTWYYLKCKKATNKTILPTSTNQSYYNDLSSDSEFSKTNPYLVEYKPTFFQGSNRTNKNLKLDLDTPENHYYQDSRKVSSLTPINLRSVPNRIKAESTNWLNRLSRAVRVENVKSDTSAEGNTISPLFLKRFNLSKPFTPKTPKTPKLPKKGHEKSNQKTLPKLPSLIQMENVKEDSTFIVVQPHTRRLGDEVSLSVGDSIKVLKNYPDEWCYLKNHTTGKSGMAPRQCLQRVQP